MEDSIQLELIMNLLEAIEDAIESGDWKVDGASDPDSLITYAHKYLRSRGYVQNSIDGSWM